MRFSFVTKVIIGIALLVLGVGAFFVLYHPAPAVPAVVLQPLPVDPYPMESKIGKSVQGRDIMSYTYGDGTTTILFLGGIHGGYEWNSVLLAYQLMDFLNANTGAIPASERVVIIPDANPDAVFKAVGVEGRFTLADVPLGKDLSADRANADGVDLNRNFDCNWSGKGVWQGKPEKTGTAAFSEPETQAIRDFVTANKPSAVVFWHSAAGAVYASQCGKGILPQTISIMNAYAKAAGYPAVKTFDAYTVTGAGEDWLASIGIPAITVELKSHGSVEWDQNLAGIKALLGFFSRS